MATGRSNQLVKQIGEYLVACELARRGFLVATFSGNVPEFDLVVTSNKGYSCPVQVKTIRGNSWQFTADKFVEISFDGKKQIIGERKPPSIPILIFVFVVAGNKYGEDKFYILDWAQVQEIIISNHQKWLDLHGGVRPKRYDSLHCAIIQSDLDKFRDNWSIIENRL